MSEFWFASIVGQKLPLLEETLITAVSSDPVVISTIIGDFSLEPNLKKNSAYHRFSPFLFLQHYLYLYYGGLGETANRIFKDSDILEEFGYVRL